jgi:hypothetical protein
VELLLNGNRLLDLAPRADLQAPANPAQRFVTGTDRFRITNRALGGLLQAIRHSRTLCQLKKLWRYRHCKLRALRSLGAFRRRWNLRLQLHAIPFSSPLWQKLQQPTTVRMGINSPLRSILGWGHTAHPGTITRVTPLLGRLRDLNHHRDIQRRAAPRTPLARRNARQFHLSLNIDLCRHSVRANGAQGLPLSSALNHCFHNSPPSHRTLQSQR